MNNRQALSATCVLGVVHDISVADVTGGAAWTVMPAFRGESRAKRSKTYGLGSHPGSVAMCLSCIRVPSWVTLWLPFSAENRLTGRRVGHDNRSFSWT